MNHSQKAPYNSNRQSRETKAPKHQPYINMPSTFEPSHDFNDHSESSFSLRIHDDVMGSWEISDPVLVDILESSAIQRLKGVHQAGATYLVRPGRDISRFDHAVGVMLLVRQLEGSLQEQIAGLIHDVSHTAFSHVSDQIFDHKNEDYHERHFHRLLRGSSIPGILQKHKVLEEKVFNIDEWPLLEQPSPNLCADRIDYTLRDLLRFGQISQKDVKSFIETLINYQGQIVVNDVNAAVWFVHQYVTEVRDLFMNPLELYANHTLASIMRLSMERNILSEEDLFQIDGKKHPF